MEKLKNCLTAKPKSKSDVPASITQQIGNTTFVHVARTSPDGKAPPKAPPKKFTEAEAKDIFFSKNMPLPVYGKAKPGDKTTFIPVEQRGTGPSGSTSPHTDGSSSSRSSSPASGTNVSPVSSGSSSDVSDDEGTSSHHEADSSGLSPTQPEGTNE